MGKMSTVYRTNIRLDEFYSDASVCPSRLSSAHCECQKIEFVRIMCYEYGSSGDGGSVSDPESSLFL